MANHRCYNCSFLLNDEFIELSENAKVLYFYLMSSADDDGFISNVKTQIRISGTKAESLEELINAGFIIKFNNNVYVIVHWRQHNKIQKDRYHPTLYQAEYKKLNTDQTNKYFIMDTTCIQNVSKLDTEYKLSKVNISKDNISEYNLIKENKSEEKKNEDKKECRGREETITPINQEVNAAYLDENKSTSFDNEFYDQLSALAYKKR